MLLRCQVNENTYQNGVLFPTKYVERVLNNSCLMFICKTYNSTLKIRNHHFMQKLTDLFKIMETKQELFNNIFAHFRGNKTPF